MSIWKDSRATVAWWKEGFPIHYSVTAAIFWLSWTFKNFEIRGFITPPTKFYWTLKVSCWLGTCAHVNWKMVHQVFNERDCMYVILNNILLSLFFKLKIWKYEIITLDPRLPFPDSVGGIFPGPATTQKVYQGIEWFSQLAGLQWLTFLSMLIRGITITLTGDWHSRGTGRPPSISFYHVT